MNLEYAKGTKVVVTVFKNHKVGTVIDRSIAKKGIAHTIESEEGKIYESVFVNDRDFGIYINSSLTTTLLKTQNDENEPEVQKDTE